MDNGGSMHKEMIEVRCPVCNEENEVLHDGRWITEEGETYRKAICSYCHKGFLVSKSLFDEVE
jgi:transcriptional regulator NrdR family protein